MARATKTPNPQAISSSSRLLTEDTDDSQSDVAYDQPPAYIVKPLEDTTGITDHQSRPSREYYVRLCPHQTLSFERFNLIAKLPNIQHAECLNALIKLPNEDFHDKGGIRDDERVCFFNLWDSYFLSSYASHVSFRYKQNSDLGQAAGFELSATWAVTLRYGMVRIVSKAIVQEYLANSNVWLCPHLRLSDGWVASAVFGAFRPIERYDDPIEQYQAAQSGEGDILRCGDCKTQVKVSHCEKSDGSRECHVATVRFLGMGASAEDSSWLEQCALKTNEVLENNEAEEEEKEKDQECCSIM
ncbi:hypothetical protein IMSHALPRED_007248 [Imshaugia aleurites]|uniref:Uncharacterized protein n=1 Tax=Imshaugia aleurites TaxID=172621 RepID=A0A8H3INL7_9LECA|nr:hypothetical protein IMSHALPRED_007248 [Imshaugia aleurites]